MATHLSVLGDLRRALLGNSLAAALLALLLGVPLLVLVTGRHVARIRELNVFSEDQYYQDVYIPILSSLGLDRAQMRNNRRERKSAPVRRVG